MLKNILQKKKNQKHRTLFPLVPPPQRNTHNSSGVQSNKNWPPVTEDQSNKVRGPISSEQSCAHCSSLVQWCRIIVELSFDLKFRGQLTCSSFLQMCIFSKGKVKKNTDPVLVLNTQTDRRGLSRTLWGPIMNLCIHI